MEQYLFSVVVLVACGWPGEAPVVRALCSAEHCVVTQECLSAAENTNH